MAGKKENGKSKEFPPELLSEVFDHLVEHIFESSNAVVVIDEAGIVRNFSSHGEQILGYKAKEVVGKNVRILMPKIFADEHDGYVDNYLKTEKAKIIGIGREVVARRKDGSEIPIYLTVSEMWAGDERTFVGVICDLSEKKEKDKQLKMQRERLMSLSTPVLSVWDQVVLVPLIGEIDTERAALLIENLLEAITERGARVAVLDVTGVVEIDTYVAQQLIKTVAAAEMLGAKVLITGIRPEVAQTLVKLGMDLSSIRALGPLKLGIREAITLVEGPSKEDNKSAAIEETARAADQDNV